MVVREMLRKNSYQCTAIIAQPGFILKSPFSVVPDMHTLGLMAAIYQKAHSNKEVFFKAISIYFCLNLFKQDKKWN